MPVIPESVREYTAKLGIALYEYGEPLWHEMINAAFRTLDIEVGDNKDEIADGRDGELSLLHKNAKQDAAINNLVSRVNAVETGAPPDDAVIQSVAESFNITDIVAIDVASGEFSNGWEARTVLAYNAEAVPDGIYRGQYVDLAAAVADGVLVGEWFYSTADSYWYEVTDTVAPAATRIYRAGSAHLPMRRAAVLAGAGATQRLIILDLTTTDCELWMEFANPASGILGEGSSNVAICWAAHSLYLANTATGLVWLDFASGHCYRIDTSGLYRYAAGIDARLSASTKTLVSTQALPSAQVDAIAHHLGPSLNSYLTSGLAKPFIAVATAAGVAVLTPDLAVLSSANGNGFSNVAILSGRLYGLDYEAVEHAVIDFGNVELLADNFAQVSSWSEATAPSLSSDTLQGLYAGRDNLIVTYSAGIDVVSPDVAAPASTRVARISSSFNTGWLQGAVLATLVDTTIGDIGEPLTVPDRSGTGLLLDVNGELSRAAIVPNGIAAFSGFSVFDFLSSAAAELDINAADFSITLGFKSPAVAAVSSLFSTGEAAAGKERSIIMDANGAIGFSINGEDLLSAGTYDDDEWHIVTAAANAAGNDVVLYCDSNQVGSSTGMTFAAFVYSVTKIGINVSGSDPFPGSLVALSLSTEALSSGAVKRLHKSLAGVLASSTVTLSDPVVDVSVDVIGGDVVLLDDTGRRNGLSDLHFDYQHSDIAQIGAGAAVSVAGLDAVRGGEDGLQISSTSLNLRAVPWYLTDTLIKARYESNPDTNPFTDAEKAALVGIVQFGLSLGGDGALRLGSDIDANGYLIRKSVATGIEAGDTQTQAGATPMTAQLNRIDVCDNAGDGVALPPAKPGAECEVSNAGAQSAAVWPADGNSIDDEALNDVDPKLLQPQQFRIYHSIDGIAWQVRAQNGGSSFGIASLIKHGVI